LLSYLLPGSGQAASGHPIAGAAWFLVLIAAVATGIGMSVSPAFPSLAPTVLAAGAIGLLWLGMLVHAYARGPRANAQERNPPAIAALLSALIPGLGQFYNGAVLKGFLFIAALLAAIALSAAVPSLFEQSAAVGLYGSAILWGLVDVFAVIDAYAARQRAEALDSGGLRIAATVTVAGFALHQLAGWALEQSVQTFRIPTDGMAPTLHGARIATARPQTENPVKRLLWHGVHPVRVHAQASGRIRNADISTDRHFTVAIGDHTQLLLRGLRMHKRPGAMAEKGDLLASGSRKAGDHVVIDKLSYRFCAPERGDIVLFAGSRVGHPRIKDGYYIRRIVGLPGERISIHPPYVMIDGKRLKEPPIFADIATGKNDYGGFRTTHPLRTDVLLTKASDSVRLDSGQYWVLGDHADQSLDSRHYGPIPRDAIVGKVTKIYWPFDRVGVPR